MSFSKVRIDEKQAGKLGVNMTKAELVASVLKSMSPELKQLWKNGELEIIGLNERITYHKLHEGEDTPYTHIFNQESVCFFVQKWNSIIITGKKIRYENNFIDD